MIQRDLLQRQIEELGKMLGRVISELYGLEGKGNAGATIEIVNEALQGQLAMDIQKLIDLPRDDFINKLRKNTGFDHANMEKLADIFAYFADYDILPEKAKLYKKCLAVYEFLENDEKIFSFERQNKIDQIKNSLFLS